ncbi:glycoside hydrolase family 88 protein [Paenibacillus doosanensis]|uniref:Unsaturated rhamnogalacturonyl hydrolase YesR n=1 Tax=Paenibacillus konkukensis TaxID=2020716 RepID=A0ABY4RV48_9BACL|nr:MULTISPECIES: glycoside hydrolase family 88 protein [Paenibacillus]MCS7460771.1 glycoside hydrolase family 88 protein [Paenibacillus doosanensis]UQZ85952.1 Unsaturated rhamnogalacturonyl hydrolase YesR [Paenibacillus konkukensis]
MTERYIDENESIFKKCGGEVGEILATIAGRYVGNHPPHPIAYRAFCADGITKKHDYSYHFNFAERFPAIRGGQLVYAWSKYWSDLAAPLSFILYCYGPFRLYANGELIYKTNIADELNDRRRTVVAIPMNKGWNHLVFEFMKTEGGCGGSFGPGSYKSNPIHVLAPSPEREGHEGWIYSEPQNEPWPELPGAGTTEAGSGAVWYPKLEWSAEEQAAGALARIFGDQPEPGRFYLAWTKLRSFAQEAREVELTGSAMGRTEIYVDGEKRLALESPGEFRIPLRLSCGLHDLVIRCEGAQDSWGFRLDELPAGVRFAAPYPVEGSKDAWLYLGPLAEEDAGPDVASGFIRSLIQTGSGGTFWRLDQPNTWVRAFAENALFGKWNYPLGVTLYGLLQTGKLLERKDLLDYVYSHIETCTTLYPYALWDRDKFGASGVLNTLATLDSLDDCGSFGATMLLALQDRPIQGAEPIAEVIADYISNKQDRLPEGALYRKPKHVDFPNATLWCDDLYMSVPFLCRYYRRTGDIRYLEDAANQFAQFKKLLYIPELQIMSHVYDFTFDKPTKVAWGRGNGWVLFSLSELLRELPETHAAREELLAFFGQLCEGYLRLQGVNGLWHQVLTDPESYEETSCTSMFLYAFARGVRFGWIKNTEPYIEAIDKGWTGMSKVSIDKFGNVYGVCRGSGYSFSTGYYKDDLSWLLNDTHGIGIVLLAGIEVLQLEQWLAKL